MSDNICVVGSLNMDIVVKVERRPRAGETIKGSDYLSLPGGKGANQAIAAATLGGKVTMISRVGNDAFGNVLLENLEERGIDTSYVIRDDLAPTGAAFITIDNSGENSIIISPGANGRVSIEDVGDIIAKSSAVILQLEIPFDTVFKSAKLASELGVQVIVNAAPAMELPDEFLKLIDVLIVNETEASLLSDVEVLNIQDAFLAAHSLNKKGAHTIIVTMGAEGAVFLYKDSKGSIIQGHQKAPEVKVTDTTGAGDTFVGAFVTAMLKGMGIPVSTQYACAAGALAVTKLGAQSAMPKHEEVMNILSQLR